MRRLNRAARLYPSKSGKHVLGFDGGDGKGADNREDVPFEPSGVFRLRTGGAACLSLGKPRAGDRFEGMLGRRCIGFLFFAFGPAWVDPLVQQPARRQSPGARLGERYDRILTKGQPGFPAIRLPVGHAPEFCPVRHDFEIHAFTVAQGVGLLPGLGVADSGVRQRCADLGILDP